MKPEIDRNIPWTESPFFSVQLAESDLSEEDKAFVKHYADEGYVIFDPKIDPVLIDNTVRELLPEFDKIEQKDRRIMDAWKNNECVRRIASSDVVMDKLRLLYKREPLPFQTLNFPEGTEQKTHSDMIHFNSVPERFMCGVWVALEDINDDNGPLHYYPQSHKLPFYDLVAIGVKGSDNQEMKKAMMVYIREYETFIEEIIKVLGLQKKTLNIKKGQCIIWSANLLHGGEKINKEGATRYSQVTHYYFENCMYYVPRLSDVAINKLFFSDLTNIKTGSKIISTYFEEEVNPRFKFSMQQKTLRMFSKIAPMFPDAIRSKIKSILLG